MVDVTSCYVHLYIQSMIWTTVCKLILCNSDFPHKSLSARHSAVNMKAVHHEWFWRRKKCLLLLFEHWLHNKQVRLKPWATDTQQPLNSWQNAAGLLHIPDTNRKSDYNYTVKHSRVHTFDNHKRFRACGYLINMTGVMDLSVQREKWWEDDRRGSSAPGTPEVYNTHICESRSPLGLCGCVTYACSGRLLFTCSSCLF